jgi:rhodanese-related sulfurtransferase
MVPAMEGEPIPELTVQEVAARLGQPGFHVYDNNGPARWQRSHVPGAKNLSAHDFDPGELPEDPHATLVFYCSGPG